MKIEKSARKIYGLESGNLIIGAIITGLLYIISLYNYLLFHTLAELFSVLVAYIVFLIIWKSKSFLQNRYLLLIGISYFFVGSFDLLHTLAFGEIGIFPGFGTNLSVQLWITARYIESISFLIAPFFLVQDKKNERNSIFPESSQFTEKIFLLYAITGTCLLLSVFFFKNFPISYVEGSGFTSFELISEFAVSIVFLCSLVFLYVRREKFDEKVFALISLSLLLSIFAEIPYTVYNHMDLYPSLGAHLLRVLSFYMIYRAIVATGFEEPYAILFRELKKREEVLTEETTFLMYEQTLIHTLLGVTKAKLEKKISKENPKKIEEYGSFMQNFSGILFQLDEDFTPIFMEGKVKEITGYEREAFLSENLRWNEIILPEDLPAYSVKKETALANPKLSLELEYRIKKKDGEIRFLREVIRQISNIAGTQAKFQGSVYDITERKKIEETIAKYEQVRVKEIHYRIKNNLQVISSMLDLQAEKFSDEKNVQPQAILDAFKDSKSRVISMALIHEELYKSKDMVTLDFGTYIERLVGNLHSSHRLDRQNINLKLDLESVYVDMDTAIPLGIVVNELVSNSFKHAFNTKNEGEISINLHKTENLPTAVSPKDLSKNVGRSLMNSKAGLDFKEGKNSQYILIVADSGSGIPEEIDIENAYSLGLQLVRILVDQIDGSLELTRDPGTEFKISFNNI